MDEENTRKKPWSGRFTEPTDSLIEQFNASVSFDQRLYRHDIRGSIAHARMLAHCGILAQNECDVIVHGLESIQADIDAGDFAWLVELEDVHMNIEARLIDRIGDVGKKLHTARSRNDQVATDLRLYLRDAIDSLGEQLKSLRSTLVNLAEREAASIMPGYTHLQPAQPVSFGHHMMAWYEMLSRDTARLADCRQRVNSLPLGAAALAGTGYAIDRAYTAKLLDFDDVSANSLDAVSDRDFVIEFLSAAALLMMHLSRCCEELVLWSSVQFDFVDLGDRFCTGSSIMPQKKNPDVPELIRGKCGRVYGHLMALLTVMKGQPLAYNKDNQEDKEPLFDTIDTLAAVLPAFTAMLEGISVKRDKLHAAAAQGYTTATDLADYLVQKDVPFRDAHEIVGKAVLQAIDEGKDLGELSLETLQQFSPAIDADVFDVLTLEGSVQRRDHPGGTAPDQVRAAIARARQELAS